MSVIGFCITNVGDRFDYSKNGSTVVIDPCLKKGCDQLDQPLYDATVIAPK